MVVTSAKSNKVSDYGFIENMQNEHFNLALRLLQQQERDNVNDLKLLTEHVKDLAFTSKAVFERALVALEKDLQIFKDFHGDANEVISGAIEKFIGEKSQFKEAISFLKKLPNGFKINNLQGRSLTIAKIALSYLNMQIFSVDNIAKLPFFKELTFFYEADIHEFEDLKKVNLASEHSLFIPNVGYVFGGQIPYHGKNRGVDCSAFALYVTYFSKVSAKKYAKFNIIDPSTKMMAAFSCLERNVKFQEVSQDGNSYLAKMIKSSPDFYLLKDFEAIFEHELLQPGNLVVWRKQNPKTGSWGGHVAIFVEFTDESMQEFYGFESLRDDTDEGEGIRLAKFPVFQENKMTYFLRCKI